MVSLTPRVLKDVVGGSNYNLMLLAFFALFILSSAFSMPQFPINVGAAFAQSDIPIPGSAGGPIPCDPTVTLGLLLKLAGNITTTTAISGNSTDGLGRISNGSPTTIGNNDTSQTPSLKLRLFDSITNRTMDRVTYAIRITNTGNNQTILEGFFVSTPGPLTMNFSPWEPGRANQTLVEPYLQEGPQYYSNASGILTVKNSLLLQKDTKYSALVGILGFDHGKVCPDAHVPYGEYSWTTTGEGKVIAVPEFPLTFLVLVLSFALVLLASNHKKVLR